MKGGGMSGLPLVYRRADSVQTLKEELILGEWGNRDA
jgi:hypothetical protein